MSDARMAEWLRAGCGRGHGDSYRSWLEIEHKNSNEDSNQVAERLPGYTRPTNFLSQIEWHLALLLLWLGALDVREQFPCWPWSHAHPLVGAPNTSGLILPQCRGLLAIAADTRIKHGTFSGTDIPYVATLDVLATIPPASAPKLVGFACKPGEKIRRAEPGDRLMERLELGRRYCRDLSFPHRIVDATLIPDALQSNLEALSGVGVLPMHLRDEGRQTAFADFFAQWGEELPYRDAMAAARGIVGYSAKESVWVFNHLAWRRRIDLDLGQPVHATYPLVMGGERVAQILRRELFREDLS